MAVRPEAHFGHYQMMVQVLGGDTCTAPGSNVLRVRELDRHRTGARLVRPAGRRLDRGELMAFHGLPFPRTESGVASLLPPTPWHYSGDLLTVEYRTDPKNIRALLPPDVDLVNDDEDPGAVAFIWADWQSCGGDGAELLDPVRSQYKEAFVVVRCRYQGQLYSRCVFIWVDKDFALVRGYLQGYPKKLGSIHQTRPITVGSAGPRLEPGARFGMTLAAADRRLANATVTLDGPASSNGFVNAHAMLHHRWFPASSSTGSTHSTRS